MRRSNDARRPSRRSAASAASRSSATWAPRTRRRPPGRLGAAGRLRVGRRPLGRGERRRPRTERPPGPRRRSRGRRGVRRRPLGRKTPSCRRSGRGRRGGHRPGRRCGPVSIPRGARVRPGARRPGPAEPRHRCRPLAGMRGTPDGRLFRRSRPQGRGRTRPLGLPVRRGRLGELRRGRRGPAFSRRVGRGGSGRCVAARQAPIIPGENGTHAGGSHIMSTGSAGGSGRSRQA